MLLSGENSFSAIARSVMISALRLMGIMSKAIRFSAIARSVMISAQDEPHQQLNL